MCLELYSENDFLKNLKKKKKENLFIATETVYLTIKKLPLLKITSNFYRQVEKTIANLDSWESRMDVVMAMSEGEVPHSPMYQRQLLTALYRRIKACTCFNGIPENSIASTVSLVRPITATLPTEEDYGISRVCAYFKIVFFLR